MAEPRRSVRIANEKGNRVDRTRGGTLNPIKKRLSYKIRYSVVDLTPSCPPPCTPRESPRRGFRNRFPVPAGLVFDLDGRCRRYGSVVSKRRRQQRLRSRC